MRNAIQRLGVYITLFRMTVAGLVLVAGIAMGLCVSVEPVKSCGWRRLCPPHTCYSSSVCGACRCVARDYVDGGDCRFVELIGQDEVVLP